MELRSLLGLDPGPSPLKIRETLPYLPFLCLVCLLLPAGLRVVDAAVIRDVPVLSQLIWPFLFLPVSGFMSGLSLGKRQGVCPLYPVFCAFLMLPACWIVYGGLESVPVLLLALPALAGNVAGWLCRRAVPRPGASV